MSVLFEGRKGWNEVTVPTDVSSQQTLVSAPDDKTRILVRRVRGTVANAFELRSGSTALETIPAGSVDIPGLQLATNYGQDLTAFGTSVTDTGGPRVQWAFDRRIVAENPL
tara:strand:- start:2044 stop:2376 length:333 start_codon:yes stop_codon:yes gene_type:complete